MTGLWFLPKLAQGLNTTTTTTTTTTNNNNLLDNTIILPVVLYGCETWSLTLREKRSLRVFENMMMRRIFGPKRDEVVGEWGKRHNEEFNDIYCSPNMFG